MHAIQTLLTALVLGATASAQTAAQATAPGGGASSLEPAPGQLHPEPGPRLPASGHEGPMLAIQPGETVVRCGVTIAVDPASTGPVLAAPLKGTCFEWIELRGGRRAVVDIDRGASGLEYLQVLVTGRASLELRGEVGLGTIDERDLFESRPGVILEGAGQSALDAEPATVRIKSPGNLIESRFGSRDHEIVLDAADNLVRLRGQDPVTVNTGTNRILSAWLEDHVD